MEKEDMLIAATAISEKRRELKKSVRIYPIPKITLRQFAHDMTFFAELAGEKQLGQKQSSRQLCKQRQFSTCC
jgi:hypothetical protein